MSRHSRRYKRSFSACAAEVLEARRVPSATFPHVDGMRMADGGLKGTGLSIFTCPEDSPAAGMLSTGNSAANEGGGLWNSVADTQGGGGVFNNGGTL